MKTTLSRIAAGLVVVGALIYVVVRVIAGIEENKAAERKAVEAGERLDSIIRERMRAEIEGTRDVTAPRPARVTGTVSRADSAGDVRDGDYRRGGGKRMPGTDLVRVSIEGDAAEFVIIFTATEDFPASVSGIDTRGYWAFDACSPDGEQCISLRAKVWDEGWSTDTVDVGGHAPSQSGAIRLDGKRLILSFSRERLPAWLDRPFKWRAGSEWKGNWKDDVPNNQGNILDAPMISFPQGKPVK